MPTNEHIPSHPLLGASTARTEAVYAWEAVLDLSALAYLQDHRVQGMVVVPGSVYLEMALAAVAEGPGRRAGQLEDIVLQHLCLLSKSRPQRLQVTLAQEEAGTWVFQVAGAGSAGITGPVHARIRIPGEQPGIPRNRVQALPSAVQAQGSIQQAGSAFYAILQEAGNDYGPTFQAIERLWIGRGEALAAVTLPEAVVHETSAYRLHPILLDVATQVLAATEPLRPGSLVLAGCDRVRLMESTGLPRWVQARQTVATADTLAGDVIGWDAASQPVFVMEGVRFKYLVSQAQAVPDRPAQTIAIAATFTAEPLEDALAFWMEELGIPADLVFAPYNQPFQQLLHASSRLSQNRAGVNVVLVRFEDWLRPQRRLSVQVAAAERDRLLADQAVYTLPNGLNIAHMYAYETDYLYEEIFEQQVYLRHGITLPDGACVVDVGANIGLFSLFVATVCEEARVFAFEPSPPAFEVLDTNAQLYGTDMQVFNCGVGDQNTTAAFTCYPRSSVFSGYHADAEQDQQALHAIVQNMVRRQSATEAPVPADLLAQWTAGRMDAETFQCPLRSLSSIIQEHEIAYIDLLKIDAERSEWAVLQGIDEADWARIGQVVVEVHDPAGDRLEAVKAVLETNGFVVVVEAETLLQGAGMYTVYARRQSTQQQAVRTMTALAQNVDDLVKALQTAQRHTPVPHLVCLCPPSSASLADQEQQAAFTEMAQRLTDQLDTLPSVHFIEPADLHRQYPVTAYYDPQTDALGHIPYTPSFFTALATALVRRCHALWHAPYKVIVLDCDQTLWQGTCGEDGPLGVAIGAPRRYLQRFMGTQQEAGMLLCLCSKNNPEDVWAVFAQHPDMQLRREQIAAWRINWQPKSINLRALAAELDLGFDSFIFLDDDPVVCAEVAAHCPDVLTLHLPADPAAIPAFLDHIWAFDQLHQIEADRHRTRLYQENRQRKAYQREALTFAAFMDGLGLEVRFSTATDRHLARMAQLTQRTNQFNMTTLRRTEAEVQALLEETRYEALVITVSDRFGDYGLVGLMIFETTPEALVVDTFLLSCRALGRGVEHQMLARLGSLAVTRGLTRVEVPFRATLKNRPALAFLESIDAAHVIQASEHATRFKIPADGAAQVVFDPESAAAAPPSALPSTEDRPDASTRVAVGRLPASQVNRIAREWNAVERIHAQVEARKRRTQPQRTHAYAPPTHALERIIAGIWQDVLGVEHVGLDDNFFEIGGTSLKAIEVLARLQKTSEVALVTVNLFDKTTVRALAEMLRSGAEREQQGGDTPQARGQQRRAQYLARQHARKNR